jgi:hypothetical protein
MAARRARAPHVARAPAKCGALAMDAAYTAPAGARAALQRPARASSRKLFAA